jgi:hypothetical protein
VAETPALVEDVAEVVVAALPAYCCSALSRSDKKVEPLDEPPLVEGSLAVLALEDVLELEALCSGSPPP